MPPPRAAPPFDQYKLYGPIFHKKEGRYYYNLVPYDKNLKRTTISVARYIMSTKLERILDPISETVDHIDENKANDDPNNLQLLTRTENIKKSSKGRDIQIFICPICESEFEREIRQVLYRGRKNPPTCSKKCGGIISHWPLV